MAEKAYFSAEQQRLYGSVVWKNDKGYEVVVTSVGSKPNYKDVQYRGEVTEYVRPHVGGTSRNFRQQQLEDIKRK